MTILIQESWGTLTYSIEENRFFYKLNSKVDEQPYVTKPLVLNCYLTYRCNMKCLHCVARDMESYNDHGLVVSSDLIEQINKSPFMVIVITGGEPLLPEYEPNLFELLSGIDQKGIIIDTNGTLLPSERILEAAKKKDVLFRISVDSIRSDDEIQLRQVSRNKQKSKKAYQDKIENIYSLSDSNCKVAIQSVLYKKNKDSIKSLLDQIVDWNIDLWFIQRLIPTRKLQPTGKRGKAEPYFLENEEYEKIIANLANKASDRKVNCVTKKDRRHNCVFLMVNSGLIYTSSESANGRVFLGKLGKIDEYFEFVSASEHSARYYSEKDRLL